MLAANQPQSAKKSGHVVCTMRPLLDCLQNNPVLQDTMKPNTTAIDPGLEAKFTPVGDISKCVREVQIFEATCDKNMGYIHDRDGLEDTRSGLFSGKRAL